MARIAGNMKNQPKAEHHEQQACTTKAQKRQRHTGEWEHACHSSDVHDHVCHDETKDTGDDQPHRRIAEPVDHQ